MTVRRTRLAVLLTHPIQYYAPWFRFIHDCADELDLKVVYGCRPSPAQQGA